MPQDRDKLLLRAAALALLLALLIAGLLRSRGTDPGAGAAGPAGMPGSSPASAPLSVVPEAAADETADEEPEFEPPIADGPLGAQGGCVGFLFRDGPCFALDCSELPKPGERDCFLLRSSPIAADPRLEALSPSSSRSFEPFLDLKEDVKSVPHLWMDLSTESVPAGEDGDRRPDRLTAINRTESLTDEWLLAWREMFRAAEEILRLVGEAPSPGKRPALVAAAGRLRDGWTRARAEGEGEREWKRRAEEDCIESVAQVLESLGLRDAGPSWPNADELLSLVMESSGPAEFGRRAVELWGAGAAGASVLVERRDGTRSRFAAREVAALDDVAFAALKSDAVDGFKVKPLKPVPGSLEALGVTFMDLEDSERASLLLLGGAKVVAVQPGSAGERAGLMVGDIVFATQYREHKLEQEFGHDERIGQARDLWGLRDYPDLVGDRLWIFRGDQEMSIDLLLEQR